MRGQSILFDVLVSTAIGILLVVSALFFGGRLGGAAAGYGAATYNSYITSGSLIASYGGGVSDR